MLAHGENLPRTSETADGGARPPGEDTPASRRGTSGQAQRSGSSQRSLYTPERGTERGLREQRTLSCRLQGVEIHYPVLVGRQERQPARVVSGSPQGRLWRAGQRLAVVLRFRSGSPRQNRGTHREYSNPGEGSRNSRGSGPARPGRQGAPCHGASKRRRDHHAARGALDENQQQGTLDP